jgi:hypothetical protein
LGRRGVLLLRLFPKARKRIIEGSTPQIIRVTTTILLKISEIAMGEPANGEGLLTHFWRRKEVRKNNLKKCMLEE